MAVVVVGFAVRAEPVPSAASADPVLPSPLALAQALDLFRARGFDLLIAEAAVQSARGDLLIAGAVPNPGLSGTFGKSYACDNGCRFLPAPQLGATLSDNNALEDFLSGKRGLRKDVAQAALQAARLSRADAERNLLFQLRQQFLQTLLAQQSVGYALEAQAEATRLLSLTQLRYKAGAISEADLARVETDKLEQDQALDTARQNLRTAQIGLTFLLGFRHSAPTFTVTGGDFLHYQRQPELDGAPPERLVEQALDHRPDLAAQRAQRERSAVALKLARRLLFPDVGLSLGYAQELNAGVSANSLTPPTFTVGLSTTLPLFYQQQGEVTKAQADMALQQVQLSKGEAQVVNDVQSAYEQYVASRALAQRMEGGLLERSRVARDLVTLQYQKGMASLLEVLDARRTYRAVVLEYVQDVTGYWTSVFRLQQAVGVETK